MWRRYKRNGTTTLFAAPSVLDGKIIGRCQQRHTHAEWLKFLRKIDCETPRDKTLHQIADNNATHKHPAVSDGWPGTRGSICISHRLRPRGSTWSSASSAISQPRGYAAVSLPACLSFVAATDEYVAHHNHQPCIVVTRGLVPASLLDAVEQFICSPQSLLSIERKFSAGDPILARAAVFGLLYAGRVSAPELRTDALSSMTQFASQESQS